MRISCLNNLKQQGLGIVMYAGDNRDYLPPCAMGDTLPPYNCYVLFNNIGAPNSAANQTMPANHGFLYTSKLVTAAKTFYCPSTDHVAADLPFSYGFYSAGGPWPWNPAGGDVYIRSAYSYYPMSDTLLDPAQPTSYKAATKLNELRAQHPMMTDLISFYDRIPHTSGQHPSALNVLWGDGHAKVSTTKAAFSQTLWPTSLDQDPVAFRKLLAVFQP